MRIIPSQIESLAVHIVKKLGLSADLTDVVIAVFEKNFEEERRLHDDARKLLDQNKGKVGLNIDEEKALSMIKKQLAKERNFVL